MTGLSLLQKPVQQGQCVQSGWSLLLSSLEVSDTQSLWAVNTNPPRNRCTRPHAASWHDVSLMALALGLPSRDVLFASRPWHHDS